jgi:hypothetical protein
MKKFTKIIESETTQKSFKIDAFIELTIEAANEGEAAYIADSILSSMKEQSNYSINNTEEIDKKIN